MRLLAAAFMCLFLLSACEDDPIIGPGGDDDTGGGSYGVIHFNTRPDVRPHARPDARQDVRPDARHEAGSAIPAAGIDSVSNTPDPTQAPPEARIPDNPKRF